MRPMLQAVSVTLIWSLASLPATLLAAAVLPNFAAATFIPGAPIDNPYFYLVGDHTRSYFGQAEIDGELVTESFEMTPLGAGPTLLGVQTTTLRDRVKVDGVVVEDTLDYYAQDTAGNVWYFGEDVVNYTYDAQGNLLGTDNHSSWLAGVDSALPGFAMPTNLAPAFSYYQEWAPFNAAVDEGQILASDLTLELGIGSFTNVLAILETLATDPDARGIKYYAPGVGLIAEASHLSLALDTPEIFIELVSTTAVPLPAPLVLLGSALTGLLTVRRRAAV